MPSTRSSPTARTPIERKALVCGLQGSAVRALLYQERYLGSRRRSSSISAQVE